MDLSTVFLIFAIILLAATVSKVVERIGQPLVVGQILAGIVLSGLGYFGWGLMRDAASSSIIAFLASFGAIILLLSAGAESRIKNLVRVGPRAIMVAIIGMVLPFAAGAYFLGPALFGGHRLDTYFFLGATLVATSVGISVAIFRALDIAHSRAAQTVLAAAILDDILGLVVLAVVSDLAQHGSINSATIAAIVLKASAFLVGALIIGRLSARSIARAMGKLNRDASTKLVFAVFLALILGYLAHLVDLQPLVGAFAAGLLLAGMTFEDYEEPEIVEDLMRLRNNITPLDKSKINQLIAKHRHNHLGGMIDTIGAICVPVFFVYSGLQINFSSLLHPSVYLAALMIAVFATFGKIAAGIVAKGHWREKLIVGVSMTPRGEVGLIFAATAKTLGVFDDAIYSTVVVAIIITTFVAPPILVRLISVRH